MPGPAPPVCVCVCVGGGGVRVRGGGAARGLLRSVVWCGVRQGASGCCG